MSTLLPEKPQTQIANITTKNPVNKSSMTLQHQNPSRCQHRHCKDSIDRFCLSQIFWTFIAAIEHCAHFRMGTHL